MVSKVVSYGAMVVWWCGGMVGWYGVPLVWRRALVKTQRPLALQLYRASRPMQPTIILPGALCASSDTVLGPGGTPPVRVEPPLAPTKAYAPVAVEH